MEVMTARRKTTWISSGDSTPFPNQSNCTHIELDQPDWEWFMELLDRPAQVSPGLRKLFSKVSVFE
jgi:hypothetical protein